MKRNINRDVKDAPIVRLMYNPQYKGLERDKDTRPIEQVLTGYRCVSEQDHSMVYFKGDVSINDTIDEARVYMHVYSLGQEYLISMHTYLIAKDRFGTNHFDYVQSLNLFLERYACKLFMFNIVVKAQKVLE